MGIETNEYLVKSNQVLEIIRDHKNKSNNDIFEKEVIERLYKKYKSPFNPGFSKYTLLSN